MFLCFYSGICLETNCLDSLLWTGLGSHINLGCSNENILFFAWSVNLHWQPRVSHFEAAVLFLTEKQQQQQQIMPKHFGPVLDLELLKH